MPSETVSSCSQKTFQGEIAKGIGVGYKLLKAQGWVTKKTDREKGEIQFPLDTNVNMSSSPSLRLHLSQMEKLLPFLPFLFGLVFCLFWMLNSLSDPGNKLSKHPKQQPIPLLQGSELSPGEPREKSLLPASHQLLVQGESSSPLWGLSTEDRLQGWKFVSHLVAATD